MPEGAHGACDRTHFGPVRRIDRSAQQASLFSRLVQLSTADALTRRDLFTHDGMPSLCWPMLTGRKSSQSCPRFVRRPNRPQGLTSSGVSSRLLSSVEKSAHLGPRCCDAGRRKQT
ncbi:unnamed protein product [Protopolystoma xenopodis]|uniref:Uncharacterized protein n=1 Tax=Protopolystoma xenopodis TaxID=117903 RepID=A0A3S5A848_9PLAT|nr:unnamed protein product [Protopolystoma xenopodis]